MTMNLTATRTPYPRPNHDDLLRRARRVIPGGVYGHLSTLGLGAQLPQFFERADGVRVWDVDGREYLDLMCSFGPMLLGHGNTRVRAAAERQADRGDTMSGPSARMVELAELFVETVPSADWAMFCKNGSDATTMAVTVSRASTGKGTILAARGAYHGALPWATPNPAGTIPEDRARIEYFEYDDLESARRAAEAVRGDLAAIVVTPIRHEHRQDVLEPSPEFARGLRALATEHGAALVLDDVRCGFRIDVGDSWSHLGVRPDLVAWSKAIANGHALAAVTGTDALRESAERIYVTGSFWYSAVAMAAAIETIGIVREIDAPEVMRATGEQLRDGLAAAAGRHGFSVRQTGPVQMPVLAFDEDPDFALAHEWNQACADEGLLVHPTHNWFLSTAHTEADIEDAVDRADRAFSTLRSNHR